jgi:hypothetical protein
MKTTNVEPVSSVRNWVQVAMGLIDLAICMYASYDLSENVSKLVLAKGGCPKAVLAIPNDRKPPTTFFNGQHMEHAYAQPPLVDPSFPTGFGTCLN